MSWPCINPDCTLDRGHGTACQPFTTHTFTDLELAERDARIRADIAAEVLAPIDRYARNQAILSSRHSHHADRCWLDLLILIERARLSTAKADG